MRLRARDGQRRLKRQRRRLVRPDQFLHAVLMRFQRRDRSAVADHQQALHAEIAFHLRERCQAQSSFAIDASPDEEILVRPQRDLPTQIGIFLARTLDSHLPPLAVRHRFKRQRRLTVFHLRRKRQLRSPIAHELSRHVQAIAHLIEVDLGAQLLPHDVIRRLCQHRPEDDRHRFAGREDHRLRIAAALLVQEPFLQIAGRRADLLADAKAILLQRRPALGIDEQLVRAFPDVAVDVIVPYGAFENRDFDESVIGRDRLLLKALHERGMLGLLRPKAAGQRAEKYRHQRQPTASTHRRYSLCH